MRRNLNFWICVFIVIAVLVHCSSDNGLPPSSTGNGGSQSPIPVRSSVINSEYLPRLALYLNYTWTNDAAIISDYNNYSAVLPQFGDTLLTSQASRQFTNLANRMCKNALTKDLAQAQKIVFRFLDFLKPPRIVSGGPAGQLLIRVQAFITHLANRLFGRSPSADELSIITDFYRAHTLLVTNDTNGTKEVAAMTCATMASAIQSLVY